MPYSAPISLAVLLALIAAHSGCSSSSAATHPQTPAGEAVQGDADDSAAEQERVPGGWNPRNPADESILAAAGEAVSLLKERQQDSSITLVEVLAAQTQVVAGTNYRLELSLQTGEGAKTVELVMYRNLKKEVSLTSVEGL